MKDSFKYILTRHSQTIHNVKKTEIQSHSDTKEKYKKSTQYITFKFNPEFVDRKEINYEEVHKLHEQYDLNQIGLVIVSPLNRCILTAKQLNIPNVKIIVQPLISSRINSAWSMGKSLRQKQMKYPGIDFSQCENQNIHWCIDVLMKDQNDFRQFYEQKKKQIKSNESIILQYLRKGKSQTYASIIKRALKFRKKLLTTYNQECDKSKKILIISHSNYLKVLTAHTIDSKGKARSGFQFDHIEFVYAKEQTLIKSDILQQKFNQSATTKQQENNILTEQQINF